MKEVGMFLLFNAVAIICSVGAVLLAYAGQDGWGWMLLVAVLSQATKMREGGKP